MSSVIFPSQNTYITPRSSSSRVTSNNCQILTNLKINKVDKIVIKASTIYASGYIGGDVEYNRNVGLFSTTNDASGYIKELDITKYVVEKSKYDTLTIADIASASLTGLYIQNTSYYVTNTKAINIVADNIKGTWETWGISAFSTMIQCALNDIAKTTNGLWIYYNGEFQRIITGGNFRNHSTNNNPMSAEFRVHYTPLGESVKLHVPKTNPQKHPFAIPYSQQQPIVNNETLGREMQSVANRTGCELKEVIRTIPDIKYLRKLGTVCYEKDANGNKTGNLWRLTKNVIYIWGDTFIQVLETWSKNWSYRSENVPINREFRSWNIPADIVQRNMSWQDYCLLTTKQEITLPPTALISEEAKQELLRGLESSFNADKYTECTNMWFKYLSNTPTGIGAVFTCSAFGFGNSLIFTGKTKDNLSAGVQRVPADDKDRNNQFCKDVYYCQDDGTAQSLDIQIASEINPGNDPEAVYLYPQSGSDYNLPTGLMLFNNTHPAHIGNYIRFNVLKDPSEQLNFTYQLNLMTDSGQLIIGSSWAESNPLVKERKENKTIKVWNLKLYIPGAAKVMTDYYGSEYAGSQSDLFEVDRVNGTITFKPVTDGVGICVTDEYNNVLIGFNGNEGATFYAKYTHDYKAIYASLKNRGVSTY